MQHARRLTKRRPPAEHWLCASRSDGTLHPTVHFYSALGTEPHLAKFTELWHARVETERPRKAQDVESTASQAAGGWGDGGGKEALEPRKGLDSSKTSRISGREVKRRTLGRLWVSKLKTREGIWRI